MGGQGAHSRGEAGGWLIRVRGVPWAFLWLAGSDGALRALAHADHSGRRERGACCTLSFSRNPYPIAPARTATPSHHPVPQPPHCPAAARPSWGSQSERWVQASREDWLPDPPHEPCRGCAHHLSPRPCPPHPDSHFTHGPVSPSADGVPGLPPLGLAGRSASFQSHRLPHQKPVAQASR